MPLTLTAKSRLLMRNRHKNLKGTSKNLPHGELSMTNIISCVVKPCNTQSITAVCRLVTDICHIRNFARVPVFREPLNIIAFSENKEQVKNKRDFTVK